MSGPRVEARDLQMVFPGPAGPVVAVRDVSLTIGRGEYAAIMGPSGCGKSTLLHILGLIDNPDGGKYWFLDEEVSTYSERQRANLRKENIGFVFQSFNLIDELTVRENIELALLYHKVSASERKERAYAVMERMEIAHRADHMPAQLSGGQQQRVAVARAVVGNQPLILADEPTGNLDPHLAIDILTLFEEINSTGTTVLFATHDHSLISKRDHRLISIDDGRVSEAQQGLKHWQGSSGIHTLVG